MTVSIGAGRICRAAGLLAGLALAGCGQIGNPFKEIRMSIPAPDEFQVISHKPIQMPSSLTQLPPPTPGSRSPLTPNPQQEAIAALAGTDQQMASSSTPSTGEEQLLSAADTKAANPEIRAQLSTDTAPNPNAPYEPQPIWEVLGLTDGSGPSKAEKAQTLDAQAEAQRLQQSGKQTPVNPNPTPKTTEQAASTAQESALEDPGRPTRNPFLILQQDSTTGAAGSGGTTGASIGGTIGSDSSTTVPTN